MSPINKTSIKNIIGTYKTPEGAIRWNTTICFCKGSWFNIHHNSEVGTILVTCGDKASLPNSSYRNYYRISSLKETESSSGYSKVAHRFLPCKVCKNPMRLKAGIDTCLLYIEPGG